MHRRTLVQRLCIVSLPVGLAGCTEATLEDAERPAGALEEVFDDAEIDLPVEQTIEVVAEGIERADDELLEGIDAFEGVLTDAGISVEHLEEWTEAGETILDLSYGIDDLSDEGIALGLGVVAGGYAALLRGGYEGDRLEGVLRDVSGREFGAFEVETAWAAAYEAGDRTARSYAGEVLHTLESR